MPHINTGPGESDFTASAYIVRLDGSEPKLLLHKHKILGVYLQFGGHIEKKETPWQTIAHELTEESGYNLGDLALLQPKVRITTLSGVDLHPVPVVMLTHAFNSEHNHTDIAWAFTASSPPTKSIEEGEADTIKLFTRTELAALPADQIPENVREIGFFILDSCLTEMESITLRIA